MSSVIFLGGSTAYSLSGGTASALQIAAGAGAGNLLVSDASGNGSWATAASVVPSPGIKQFASVDPAGANTYTFTVPAEAKTGYSSLRITADLSLSATGGGIRWTPLLVRLNGDSGTKYEMVSVWFFALAQATGVYDKFTLGNVWTHLADDFASATPAFSHFDMVLPLFRSSGFKSFGCESFKHGSTDVNQHERQSVWGAFKDAAAIDSVTLYVAAGGNFIAGSNICVFGVV